MKKVLLSFSLSFLFTNLFAQHVVSGFVYNDHDAGTINASAIPQTRPPEQLRVVLISVAGSTETIAAVATVNPAAGNFSMSGIANGSYYAMLITPNTTLTIGDPPPPLILESGWTYTGESWSGTTPDALVNGRTEIFTMSTGVNTLRFGVQERPFSRNKMNVLLNNTSATAVALSVNTGSAFTAGAGASTTILEGMDNGGGTITHYTINKLPQYGTLYMSGNPVTSLAAVATLTPAQFNTLAYLPGSTALAQEMDFFTYYVTDNASTQSNNATYVIPFPLLDGDNDGVVNRFDQDSDNDGIPDLAECSLNDVPTLLGEYINGNFMFIRPSHFGLGTGQRVGQNLTADISGNFGKPAGSIIVHISNANTHPDADEFYANDSTGASQWSITGTLGAYTVIDHGQQYFSYDTRTITILNGTPHRFIGAQSQADPLQSNWIAGNDGQYNWWLTNNNPATTPTSMGVLTIGLINPEPKYFQVASSANNYREWATYFVSILPECDDDNDGIPNRLDLDSDNDGCADALEGSDALAVSATSLTGGTVWTGPGSAAANRNLCSAPACVDVNGIPLSVTPGGQTPVETYNPSLISLACQQALPVKISSFNAQRNHNSVLLTWTTENEQNNKGFEVERSTDGLNWHHIAFKPTAVPNGNSSQKTSYRFTDNAPVEGQNIYRLKQTDLDGSYEYSGARTVLMPVEKKVRLFPNPVSHTLNIRGLEGHETATVYDVSGRVVYVQKITAPATSLPVHGLPDGIYQLQITSPKGLSTAHRFLIKK